MLAAGHRVPHAGASEDVHIVDYDKRFLLQGDDGEMVFIRILVSVGVVPWPHWEHQRQRPILPTSHLSVCSHTQTQTRSGTVILISVLIFLISGLLCKITVLICYLLPFPLTVQNNDNQFGVGLVTIWSKGQVSPLIPYVHHVSETQEKQAKLLHVFVLHVFECL